MNEIKQNYITPLEGYDPYIGKLLWMMQDTRRRTLSTLEGLSDKIINWIPPRGSNSIGTLLYHLSAIEISWLYEDILGGEGFSTELSEKMNYSVREDDGRLTPVTIEPLSAHINRLQFCRNIFLSKLSGMTAEEFLRRREVDDYETTPEWVIHHLMQHEAEHRGQIGEIRQMAEAALGV